MRGHVRERSPGAWELRADAGRDALSGRKRYKTKTVRVRGRRESEKALAAFVTELETSGVAADGTFGELVERWIATAVPDWSPNNEVTVRNTASYHLGGAQEAVGVHGTFSSRKFAFFHTPSTSFIVVVAVVTRRVAGATT